MRILVVSDTHGRYEKLRDIVMRHRDIKEVFFLGDVVSDAETAAAEFCDTVFRIVSGNCDCFPVYPSKDIAKVGGKTVFFTHGHTLSVKYGLERLEKEAAKCGADVVLYGHTHIASQTRSGDVLFLNPGSLHSPREGRPSYAIIDFSDAGIMPNIIEY